MADVTPTTLDALTLDAMRYALGRMSYAPSEVAEIIQRHWRDLTDAGRANLLRSLTEAVIDHDLARRSLGDPCDVATWRGLLGWMEGAPCSE